MVRLQSGYAAEIKTFEIGGYPKFTARKLPEDAIIYRNFGVTSCILDTFLSTLSLKYSMNTIMYTNAF